MNYKTKNKVKKWGKIALFVVAALVVLPLIPQLLNKLKGGAETE
ncbi:MAG TPA: hypothetical protein VGD89_14495 [Flavipsychrobacter sp.]